ncbi:TetR/AcrR family transcriptional regulator [Sphaerisporangium aureirubrum]|uniref:TetR/AcrR family transcriptional regulator n=1 Tax=Sphaerisporangium aureirubrum TaxID=1544736 RepID=A0ABW1NFE0_9ACTN
MKHAPFVRARQPEQKRQRREAILGAARELALQHGVRDVSLGGVAVAVGLAKSNVSRYFGTREEIYLELAAEEWRGWGEAVAARLGHTSGAAEVAAALAETLAARPLLCDLIGHAPLSLEHNVSLEAARAFKRAVIGVVAGIGTAVGDTAAGLTATEGGELAGAAAALAGVLYPVANPSPVLAELYTQDPEIAATCPPFLPTLTRALTALIAGIPSLR